MTRGDKAIFLFVLIFSVFSIIFTNYIFSGTANHVVVEIDGKIYGKYEINGENEEQILEINTKYGYNKVVIDKRGAYISEASCVDKIDVKAGRISECGAMLICLPNRLVVRIEGDDRVDAVAY